jgi:hypothetical protein
VCDGFARKLARDVAFIADPRTNEHCFLSDAEARGKRKMGGIREFLCQADRALFDATRVFKKPRAWAKVSHCPAIGAAGAPFSRRPSVHSSASIFKYRQIKD